MLPKILLVDDHEDNLLAIETILETENYQLVKALSGREALKILLHEMDFALILMDVQMPNMNGFETAALIYAREKLKHIPIIFITAHNYGEENIYKGYRAGAVDYLYKPINADLLRAKVSVFVDLYQKNHRLLLQEQKLITINRNLEVEIAERKTSAEQVKALNLELLKTIDGLEAANKDLDRFAFMASHDLQEPLRKIFIFSDFLFSKYESKLDEEAKNYINKIQQSVHRLQTLIKDILTFSTITHHHGKFVNSDLNVIINEVLIDMNTALKEKNANVIVEKLPSLRINPVLMRPLFYNLISNSLKYSQDGVPPIIKIYTPSTPSVLNEKDNGRWMRIYVEDNGIGFEQQYAEHIFSMFTRLHPDKPIEGTGVGLALCKRIVEDHHGFISARSKLNEGALFIVSLPMNVDVENKGEPLLQSL